MNKTIQNNIRQLAQLRVGNTISATLLAPLDKTKNIVYSIHLANTTGTAAVVSIFHDVDGSVFDQTTALLYRISVPANDTTILLYEAGLPINSKGNLGIQLGTADAITATIYGIELSQSGGI